MTARLPKMAAAFRILFTNPVFFILVAGLLIIAGTNRFAYRALPEDPAARLEALKKAGLAEEAEGVYQELLAAEPLDPDLHFAYIQNHFEIPSVKTSHQAGEEIYRYYQELAARESSADLGRLALGLLQAQGKDYGAALETYRQVQNRSLKYLNFAIGQTYQGLGRLDKAEIAFEREIASGGETRRATAALAGVYLEQGRPEEVGRLLADLETAPHVGYDARRQAALALDGAGRYLALTFLEPWSWSSPLAGLLALLAGAAWALFFRKVDLAHRMPPLAFLAAPLLGALFTPAVFILQDGLDAILPLSLGKGAWGDLAYTTLHIGLVEELVKLLPALLAAAALRRTKTPLDWLLLGGLSALGFATFENALYFSKLGFGISASRFLYSVPLHLAATGLAATAWANQGKHRLTVIIPTLGLAAATLLHGLFDFFTITQTGRLSFLGPVLLLLSVYGLGRTIRSVQQISAPAEQTVWKSIGSGALLFSAACALMLAAFAYLNTNAATEIANRQLLSAALLCLPALLVTATSLGRPCMLKSKSIPILAGTSPNRFPEQLPMDR